MKPMKPSFGRQAVSFECRMTPLVQDRRRATEQHVSLARAPWGSGRTKYWRGGDQTFAGPPGVCKLLHLVLFFSHILTNRLSTKFGLEETKPGWQRYGGRLRQLVFETSRKQEQIANVTRMMETDTLAQTDGALTCGTS